MKINSSKITWCFAYGDARDCAELENELVVEGRRRMCHGKRPTCWLTPLLTLMFVKLLTPVPPVGVVKMTPRAE
jgi:hypothetical protein